MAKTRPLRKRLVFQLARILALPFLPGIALGYWSADDNLTYLECLKKIWRDF